MSYNPFLFEINTRVFLRNFDIGEKKGRLNDIPKDYWKDLKEYGYDYVWLMGVWQNSPESVKKYCLEEELMNEYDTALKDWNQDDVIGSPYSIDDYRINKSIGTSNDLVELKKYLNSIDLKLILDFVPNHFSALSGLIESEPDIFLQTSNKNYKADPYTYFTPNGSGNYFAHGRDPFFPAWQDTVQVNYYSEKARRFMIKKLKEVSQYCDGVRCDMAMLCLNNIFHNTWGATLDSMQYNKPENEFWDGAISEIKKSNREFIFIAEAYWDLEHKLQQLGFDYTYDKKLTDRIKYSPATEIRDHLLADISFQKKSVRFIENHDEERSLKLFGEDILKAAAVIYTTIPGMKLVYEGQTEGKKVKLPLQLSRAPKEKTNKQVKVFYDSLIKIVTNEIFKKGNWELLETLPAWEDDNILSFKSILAWQWKYENKKRLVLINCDKEKHACRVKCDILNRPEKIIFKDLINNQIYDRSKIEIEQIGLYIELESYHCHIFEY